MKSLQLLSWWSVYNIDGIFIFAAGRLLPAIEPNMDIPTSAGFSGSTDAVAQEMGSQLQHAWQKVEGVMNPYRQSGALSLRMRIYAVFLATVTT